MLGELATILTGRSVAVGTGKDVLAMELDGQAPTQRAMPVLIRGFSPLRHHGGPNPQ
jgi:hypothetical protein